MNNFLDINIHERFLVVQPFIKLTELLYVNLIFDLKIPVDINNENVTVLDAIFGVNGVKNIITKNIVAFEAVSSRGEVVNFSKAENPSLFVDFSSLPREICTITKLKLIF